MKSKISVCVVDFDVKSPPLPPGHLCRIDALALAVRYFNNDVRAKRSFDPGIILIIKVYHGPSFWREAGLYRAISDCVMDMSADDMSGDKYIAK